MTSSFRDRWTPCCRKWGCCVISVLFTGRSGFAAFSFLWPQLLLLPSPQPCKADDCGNVVLCPVVVIIFSTNVLCKGALDPLHWHNRGTACNGREIWIQKVETILWEYGSVISIFLFWWVLVRMREQSADFAKSYEGFPELGSTMFRSSGFWLSLLEIVTAWIWVFHQIFP